MIIVYTCVAAFVLAAPVRAQPNPSPSGELGLDRLLAGRPVVNRTLAIDEAVRIALRESPVVRGATAEVEAMAAQVRAARAETRPWLSANTFLTGGSNANIVPSPPPAQPQMLMGLPPGAFADANLMMMYPLYTGGRLQAMVRQAAAMRGASEAEREMQRQEVALLTRTAYREVLARRALVEVAQARLDEDEERLRIDRARLAQERIPAYYVRRDEAEAAQARQELTNARRDAELALVQLRTVMGIAPTSRVDVTGQQTYEPSADVMARLAASVQPGPSTPGAPDALDALLRLAERRRPELQAAAERVRAADADTAVARSAFRPQVSLFAMGDLMKREEMDAFAGVTYGVAASLPLYNGGQRRARVEAAEARRRQQQQERERIALQVAQEVQAALLNLRAAEQNIQTARAALTAAREEQRVARTRYEAGRSVVVEVLDALAARTRAESNVVQALFQYNVARDQLLRAVGQLDVPATVPGAK